MNAHLLPFVKMHGLGNDFVILDARYIPFIINREIIRFIASRRTSIGCDQVIVIMPSHRANAFLHIYNADGSEVFACGNATRCVSALLMREERQKSLILETQAGFLYAFRCKDDLIAVDMGLAQLDWKEIPLTIAIDTLNLPLSIQKLVGVTAISMGNPHAIFFVTTLEQIDLVTIGSYIEKHTLFPMYTNIGIVKLLKAGQLRVKVWERGVGVTRACGTNACAAIVAAVRCGLVTTRQAQVVLDGGVLFITYYPDGRIVMAGPTKVSFTGFLPRDLSMYLYRSALIN